MAARTSRALSLTVGVGLTVGLATGLALGAPATPVAPPLTNAEAPPPTVPPSSAFVVAIDPGHGGSNLGAADAAGLTEKDVTLALARRVRELLAGSSSVQVVLCRDADVLVPIRARSRCAAASRAGLFISLHANAAPAGVAPGTQRGFELYVLPPADVEDDANLAALATGGAAGAWEAHRVHAAAERSLGAARALETRLKEALSPRLARGIREGGAALDVLRGGRGPGVLVEVGFLDHPQDRETLGSPAGRDRLARALAAGVLDWVAAAAR